MRHIHFSPTPEIVTNPRLLHSHIDTALQGEDRRLPVGHTAARHQLCSQAKLDRDRTQHKTVVPTQTPPSRTDPEHHGGLSLEGFSTAHNLPSAGEQTLQYAGNVWGALRILS